MNIKELKFTSRNNGILNILLNLIHASSFTPIGSAGYKFTIFYYHIQMVKNGVFEVTLEGDNLYGLLKYLSVAEELEL